MKKQTTSKAMLCPEAYVSVKKSRLPIYNGNTVYLKNSQEFELELFNPTSKTVALYIKINGIQTSNTLLVIRPGMRYFLDRYVDESRKFAFNTYMADDSIEGKTATGGPNKLKKGETVTAEYLQAIGRYDWFDIRLSDEEDRKSVV